MDKQIESTASDLREAISDFLIPFQTTRVVKRDAFQRMHGHAQELMRLLKGTEMVSKFLLNELFTVPLVIRAESPYFKDERQELEEMANQIELCFSLILKGEAPEDRVPGVPRVI
jgi:hypothetical protein